MQYHKQLNRHDPENGIYGDCYRTCIACMLDMEPANVPNFWDKIEGELRFDKEAMKAWLHAHGFKLIAIPFACDLADLLYNQKHLNPNILFILCGSSATGVNHHVVADHNGVLWDPSQNESGISGPCDDGLYWIEFFVPTQFQSPTRAMGALPS